MYFEFSHPWTLQGSKSQLTLNRTQFQNIFFRIVFGKFFGQWEKCIILSEKKRPLVFLQTFFSFFFQNKQSEEEESAPTDEGIYDSVELSFMGKLEKADKKDTEDQRVFELLEEAALDSSFCSRSISLWSFKFFL